MTKFLLVTSVISPHQMPLAQCFAAIVGENSFRFVATHPPVLDPQAVAWKHEENSPWVLRAGEIDADRSEFLQWWDEADVVLCGERLTELMEKRIQTGKQTFYMSERWWKPPVGLLRLLHPRFARMAIRFRRLAESPFFHYLPTGYHAAADMKRLTAFPNRMWMWGYFTARPHQVPDRAAEKRPMNVLYAGRMLKWKRVDTLIRGFQLLAVNQPNARLTLIGDGPCRPSLEKLATRLDLGACVSFRFSLPMEEVWQQMHSSHIYVLPSNGYEGWGAVVNEAMSLGCTVVASDAAGSAKTMIRNGENGCLFRPGDWRQLGEILIRLSNDEELRNKLAMAAQKTIRDCWSPKVAAERLLAVSDALLSRRPVPVYKDGPMSRV